MAVPASELLGVKEFGARKAAVAIIDWQPLVEGSLGGGIRAEYFRADVSLAAQVQQVIAAIVSSFGGIDVVVNNAGIQRYGSVTTISEDEWDEVLNVNLKSASWFRNIQFRRCSSEMGEQSSITGSVQSVTAQRNSAHYVTSKHALLGLTRSIALDYGKRNIRANCVLPGAIDTPMLHWSGSLDQDSARVLAECDRLHIRGKIGRAEEVARAIAFPASDLASFVTGAAIPVDGGLLVPVGRMAFQEAGTGAVKALAVHQGR